jgi:hypothetical protein
MQKLGPENGKQVKLTSTVENRAQWYEFLYRLLVLTPGLTFIMKNIYRASILPS